VVSHVVSGVVLGCADVHSALRASSDSSLEQAAKERIYKKKRERKALALG
jgi:hypothetical protein